MSRITLMIESSHDNSSLVGLTVNKLCSGLFSEEEVWGIELSVVEAVSNVIKHAYKGYPEGIISIVLDFQDKLLQIEVKDNGSAIPDGVFEQKDAQVFNFEPENPATFPENGMGLALMKQLMDKVSYESHHGTNTLRLIKNRLDC